VASLCLQTFSFNPIFLLLTEFFLGVSAGMFPGALTSYVFDKKIKMGRFSSFRSLGWSVANLIAGFIAILAIQLVFAFSAFLFAAAFLLAILMFNLDENREPADDRQRPISWFPSGVLIRNSPIFLGLLIRHSSAFALWTLWSLFLLTLGADTVGIGIIQAANTVVQFIVMFVVIDRLKANLSIPLGMVLTAVTFVGFALSTTFPGGLAYLSVLILQVLLGCSWGFLWAGSVKYVTESGNERGTASGLLSSVESISGVFGPLIAMLFTVLFPSSPYIPIILFGALMALVATGVFLIMEYVAKRNLETSRISNN
jgi:MFS family permease